MPQLYTIYKKHEKRLKYASYIHPEKYDTIFQFLKNCEDPHNYIISLVAKNKYALKQGFFSNYDSGIIVCKHIKTNKTIYEYIKNHYLFIENIMKMNKENQLEKYAPIVIEFDNEEDEKQRREKKREKKRKRDREKHSEFRNTLEAILEEVEEDDDQNENDK
jgi:hypothetical protein